MGVPARLCGEYFAAAGRGKVWGNLPSAPRSARARSAGGKTGTRTPRQAPPPQVITPPAPREAGDRPPTRDGYLLPQQSRIPAVTSGGALLKDWTRPQPGGLPPGQSTQSLQGHQAFGHRVGTGTWCLMGAVSVGKEVLEMGDGDGNGCTTM